MIGGRARSATLIMVGAFFLAGCSADIGTVDFATLARADSPNDALACPVGACAAPVDLVTQPVELSAAALAEKVLQILPSEPRVELVARGEMAVDGSVALVLVQRSAVFRFPDTVNIMVRPVDDRHALIAVYSRSNYGYGDFGVNLARVKDWLAKLGVESTENR